MAVIVKFVVRDPTCDLYVSKTKLSNGKFMFTAYFKNAITFNDYPSAEAFIVNEAETDKFYQIDKVAFKKP